MAKAKLKTTANDASVPAFLAQVEPERRREDGLHLLGCFSDWTGWEPRLWGPSIIGFGRYEYRYASGREGEFLVTGFSPRKSNLVIYVMPGYRDMSAHLSRLGKHKIGKSCLYINKLADIDEAVLRALILDGIAYMKATYPVYDR